MSVWQGLSHAVTPLVYVCLRAFSLHAFGESGFMVTCFLISLYIFFLYCFVLFLSRRSCLVLEEEGESGHLLVVKAFEFPGTWFLHFYSFYFFSLGGVMAIEAISWIHFEWKQ